MSDLHEGKLEARVGRASSGDRRDAARNSMVASLQLGCVKRAGDLRSGRLPFVPLLDGDVDVELLCAGRPVAAGQHMNHLW